MSMNNLLDLFVGRWEVVLHAEHTSNSGLACPVYVEIKDNGNICYCNAFENFESGSYFSFKGAYINLNDGTLFAKDDRHRLRISFFRQDLYDTIFALFEDVTSPTVGGENSLKPVNSWCARRMGENNQILEPGDGSDIESQTDWDIKISGGKRGVGAKHTVRLKKISDMEDELSNYRIDRSMGPFIVDDQIPMSIPPSAKETLIYNIGYVLCKKDNECDCGKPTPWWIYDVVAFDEHVKSFNSVFGFRSLEYSRGNGGADRRIFATFNSNLLTFSSTSSHGRLKGHPAMVFEEKLLTSSDGDPDIGVWVGVPSSGGG